MANSLQGVIGQNPQNMQAALAQLRQNPSQVLRQAGFNIPSGMNNPNQILNYMLQSGQVGQNRIAQVMQMAQHFRR